MNQLNQRKLDTYTSKARDLDAQVVILEREVFVLQSKTRTASTELSKKRDELANANQIIASLMDATDEEPAKAK